MSERRAVQVSHEMWRLICTEGNTIERVRCIQGIPDDATLVATFNTCGYPTPDPVFVFESDKWSGPAEEWLITVDGQQYHTQRVVFSTEEQ